MPGCALAATPGTGSPFKIVPLDKGPPPATAAAQASAAAAKLFGGPLPELLAPPPAPAPAPVNMAVGGAGGERNVKRRAGAGGQHQSRNALKRMLDKLGLIEGAEAMVAGEQGALLRTLERRKQ